MELRHIISEFMLFNAVIAFSTAVIKLINKQAMDRIHRLFIGMLFSSAVWSFGFSLLYVQTNTTLAHFCKSFAIMGTVGYMITTQSLVSVIAEMKRKTVILFRLVALLGIPVYLLSVDPSQTTYYISEQFGFMTYTFHSGPVSTIYTIYFILVSINILICVIYMLTNKKLARVRAYGKRFLVVLLLTLGGTIFDMVFPAIGYDSLPGSNITQFWATVAVYFAMRALDKNRISVENMAEYVYSSINDSIVLTDQATNFMILNKAAYGFFGLGDNSDIKKIKLRDMFDIPDDGYFESRDRVAVYELKDRQEERPCTVTVSRINDKFGDTIGFITVIRDISERVKYIEALQQAREEAEALNNTKTTFLANMSHEIRTPMNSIIGFTEIILKQDMPREQIVEYSENIRDSAYDLLKLINEILDITKVEAGKVTVNNNNYNVKKLIEGIVTQIETLARKKHLAFNIKVEDNIPSVLYGDETKMREILINILNNAVKYTKKGSVTLNISAKSADEKHCVMEAYIEDTGVGIKREELDSIFRPFEQVNKNLHAGIEGTGLGLAIVKGYVEAMGGDINVESTYGKGSRFRVSIKQAIIDPTPIKKTEGHSITAKSSIGEVRFDGVKVLVVDDNLINLKVAGKTLECYGLVVDMAESGEKAIEMCRAYDYPIVFLDQMMPEMDGVETLHELRKISPYYAETAKIVALTANALVEVRNELIAAGFDEYLKKPLEFSMLETLLKEYLGEKTEGKG